MSDRITIKTCNETVAIIGESKQALENGRYTQVTQSEVTTKEAESSGQAVIRDFAATAALLAIMASKRPFHSLMDDRTWGNMAQPLKAIQNSLSDMIQTTKVKPPVFPTTPLDLPQELAESRVDHLLSYPNIQDIPSLEELNELLMAANTQRDVMKERFREESLSAPLWATTTNSLEGCKELKTEVDRRLFIAEGNPNADPSTLSLLNVAIQELEYAIANHAETISPAGSSAPK